MDSCDHKTLCKLWPHSCRNKVAEYVPVLPNAALPVNEDILHGDHVPFHARDFRDAHDLACAVAHTADLHYHVKGGRNLPPYSRLGNTEICHCDHRFQAA